MFIQFKAVYLSNENIKDNNLNINNTTNHFNSIAMENQKEVEATVTNKPAAPVKPFKKGKKKPKQAQTTQVVEKPNIKPKFNIDDLYKRYPEHLVNLYMILNNNAEIRRFTALGILNYLLQTGEISGEKRYCKFKVDKFIIRYDGLVREYRYTEVFFINALIAAFTSFASSAEKTISQFTKIEVNKSIDNYASKEEIDKIAKDIIEQTNKDSSIVEIE